MHDPILTPDEPDDVVLDRVVAYYHRTLLDAPTALNWLRERGIRDPEVLTHFRLGFCDRSLPHRLPQRNRKAGAAIREQLDRLGILRESGHEALRGSLVVPIGDGPRIVNLYGHKVGDNLRAGTAMEVVLTDADVGVLNPSGLVPGGKVILAGTVLDVLVWWSAGHRNVTTTLGRPALPKGVRDLLVERRIRSVAVALRREDPAFEPIAADLRSMGIEVVQVVFPADTTAIDAAKGGPEALTALLRAAAWISAPEPGPRPPPPPAAPAEAPSTASEVVLTFGDRRWRVRGVDQITSHGTMPVNLLVTRAEAAGFHVDHVEVYSARQRSAFLAAASAEVGLDERILKKDLGAVLLHLERLVDERLRAVLEPEREAVALTDADRQVALDLLRDPGILDRIGTDLDRLGLVGEPANKVVAYLAAISRKMGRPLAVVVQSAAGSGKSTLLDAVLRLVPEEDRLSFSAITGRSLYYLPADGLSHKVLSVAEEEGAGNAAYALKVLQSEGSLSIASTAKDAKTGRLSTHTYRVSGPVALLMTTTSLDVDEELSSRCLVLGADESREQTRAVHREQRRRLALDALGGGAEAERVVKVHHDAQRLLRPLAVVVPVDLRIGVPDHRVGHRREHGKVLGLVQAVALLRQHQRPVRETDGGVKYTEATEADVADALRLFQTVSGKSTDDLPPGTRNLLDRLDGHVRAVAVAEAIDVADVRFTRRQIRETLEVGDTQLRVHLSRLVALEYVVVHRADGRVVYEVVEVPGRVGGVSGPCRPGVGGAVGPGGSDASPG